MLKPLSKEDFLNDLKEQLKTAPPCSHPGCYSHISHKCEGCYRLQGNLPESEKEIIRAIINKLESLPEEIKYTKYNRFEIMDI